MVGNLAIVLSLLVGSSNSTTTHKLIGSIGGVTDCSSRVGREERIAMEMAVHDFDHYTGYKLVLHLRDLSGKSTRAPSLAIDLIKNQQVQAIVGTLTLQEAIIVTELDDFSSKVPIISLATPIIIPSAMQEQVLLLIHMGHDISVHMRCIASIINYFQWQKVVAIYEDKNAHTSDLSIITLLSDALRDIGADIEHYLAFPGLSSLLDPKTSIQAELQKLMGKRSQVFIVVQSSLPFTALLFEQAKQLGMMEKGHVWIATDGTTSLLDSLDSSVITSMEGVLGFKTYFLDSVVSFKSFKTRFRRKFQSEYPEEEENPDPSVFFALRAYDAVWTVSKAMERLQETRISRTLLSSILSSNFKGLSSDIWFINTTLAPVPAFRMVNVVGKSYREMGFWSPKFGFSTNLIKHDSEEKGINSNVSTKEALGRVYWPGGKTSVRIQLMETNLSNGTEKPLLIGLPVKANFTQFMVIKDGNQNVTFLTGLSIDVFQAAVRSLPYQLPYKFIPFIGSSDEMVEMVSQKKFDAVIGDVEITADRSLLVEFSQPYVESGLVMVVPLKSNKSKDLWMFMKPFTKAMWSLMAAMSLLTGLVVWTLEHRKNEEFRGPAPRQIGKVLWFSFTTLYLGQSEALRTNLSRFVLAPWLFLVLIVSASYTASLTSMMTTLRFEQSALDVGSLKRTNAAVGCDGSTLSVMYLVQVLGFKKENINSIALLDDYAKALGNGHIKVAFLLTPQAKVFTAKYCKDFTTAGPTYKLGGFGIVFPKNSSLALDISVAIQRLTENGYLQQLENEMVAFFSCSNSLTGTDADQSLGPEPFGGLFILSGCASTIALLIAVIRRWGMLWNVMTFIQMTFFQATLMGKGIWNQAVTVLARNYARNGEQQLPKRNAVSQTEGNSPPAQADAI